MFLLISDHILSFWSAEVHLCCEKQHFDTLCRACPRCYCEPVLSNPGQIMTRHTTSLNAPREKAPSQTDSDTRCVKKESVFYIYIDTVQGKAWDFRKQ